MKISVILAHPEESSFNHAIAAAAVQALRDNGHDVFFHDLYFEKFDPILPAQEIPSGVTLPFQLKSHCDEIAEADGIVIVHPNWWGQPPAILKGWIDRVFRPDVAYRFLEGDDGEGIPVGMLKAQKAIVFNTSNTPSERENEVFGDPLELLWRKCIFDLCGIKTFYRKMFRVVVTSTEEQRREWLAEVEEIVSKHFNGETLNA